MPLNVVHRFSRPFEVWMVYSMKCIDEAHHSGYRPHDWFPSCDITGLIYIRNLAQQHLAFPILRVDMSRRYRVSKYFSNVDKGGNVWIKSSNARLTCRKLTLQWTTCLGWVTNNKVSNPGKIKLLHVVCSDIKQYYDQGWLVLIWFLGNMFLCSCYQIKSVSNQGDGLCVQNGDNLVFLSTHKHCTFNSETSSNWRSNISWHDDMPQYYRFCRFINQQIRNEFMIIKSFACWTQRDVRTLADHMRPNDLYYLVHLHASNGYGMPQLILLQIAWK